MKPRFAAHTPPKNSDQWHSLQEHLSDVAARALQYADKFNAGQLGYYAGLWHDVGKYNPQFQQYLEQCAVSDGTEHQVRSVPHAIYGAKLAWELLKPIAPIIYGHHGGLPEKEHMKSRLLELEETSYQAALGQAQQEAIDLQPTGDFNALMMSLCKDAHSYELLTRMLFSCLVDADYLDTEEHFAPDITQQRKSSSTPSQLWDVLQLDQTQLLATAENTVVNEVRAEVYQCCVDAAELAPGVFRLAVPTGGGKTRSGIAFALRHAVQYGLDRVIVAVPYTSIIEQTVSVYRSIFGEEAVLEHHSAASEPTAEDARRSYAQARLATQNWDAPLVVTTTVQLFESLFANRPSRCRKLHNIVGSVIVLDEVQALPMGLLSPILSALKELAERYRVSIVLCTATQPALEEQSRYLQGFTPGTVRDIVPNAQAERHFSMLRRVRYEVSSEVWSWQQLAQDIQNNHHQQVLVVLNTRKDALSVLDAVQEFAEDESAIFHLSTLLCGAHRRQVLDAVKQRLRQEKSCWLISTQVVEAGVDLDFPAVYRATGPLDRIVQAAGRCNREGKRQQGRVVIFNPEAGRSPKGEYATAISETVKLLKRDNLDLYDPNIFREYFRCIYKNVKLDKYGIQNLRASCNFPKVAEEFRLIRDDTTPVVIQFDDRVKDLLRQIRHRGLLSKDYRLLQPYMVSLRQYEFGQSDGLREEIAPGLWVWQGSYDGVKGIGIGSRAIEYDPADLIQ